MPRPLCRHCNRAPANRPRDLCWACYYAPGVRGLYAPRGDPKYSRRSPVANFVGAAAAPEPARALPGSPGKLAVLAARAAARQELFHAGDAERDDPEPSPGGPTP